MNATAAFYAQAYGYNKAQSTTGKWNQPMLGVVPPLTTTPGQLTPPGQKKSKFKPRPGVQVQMFYCETCKISCAGPQTYKEHLEGQKHKKKETLMKSNEKKTETSTPIGADVQKNFNRFKNQNIIQCPLCEVACTGRDAYAAHIRGSKHQKTLKLHQKLGKPIPADLLAPHNSNLKNLTPVPPPSKPGTVVITAPPKVSLPPVETGPNLAQLNTTSDAAPANPYLDQHDEEHDTSNHEPIGREYIETRMEGKILTFYCKLCDCKFNDPNAKDMHTKGRRHRLAYKKKVDPSLIVDLKGPVTKMAKNGRLSKIKPHEMTGINESKPLLNEPNAPNQNIQSLMSQNLK